MSKSKAVVIRGGGKSAGKGALSRAAEDVRKAGRYGDDMLVHISESEYAQLREAYGEPTVNPETGLPEFFLGNLVSALLPAALNTFTPIGSTLGSVVGSFLPGMTSGVTDFLGNALVGAGLGALTNRNSGQGALYGALGGGFGPMLASGLGLQGVGTTGALGNLLGGVFGGGQAAGLAPNGLPLNGPGMLPPPRPPGNLTGAFGNAIGGAAQAGGTGGLMQQVLPALAFAGALGGGGGKQQQSAPPPEYTAEQRRIAADNARPLEQISNVRFRTPAPSRDYLRYGIDGGEEEFYGENKLPKTQRAATGGHVRGGALRRMAEGGFVPPQAPAGAFFDSPRLPRVGISVTPFPAPPPAVGGAPMGVERQQFTPTVTPATPTVISKGGDAGAPPSPAPTMGNFGAFGVLPSMPPSPAPTMGNFGAFGVLPSMPPSPAPTMGNFGAFGVGYAEGGDVRGPGDGMSDEIPALLSDGEYVIDAHTVAMLGNGSSDAGAAMLDRLREQVRKHKGAAMAKGGMPPRSQGALQYIKKGAR